MVVARELGTPANIIAPPEAIPIAALTPSQQRRTVTELDQVLLTRRTKREQATWEMARVSHLSLSIKQLVILVSEAHPESDPGQARMTQRKGTAKLVWK